MRPLTLVVCAVPLLVSGCFGHCGPSSSAEWTEPGLFDHLAETNEVVGVPDAGLPFDEATHLPERGPMTLWRLQGPALEQPEEPQRGHHHRGATIATLQAPGWTVAPWVHVEDEPDVPYVRVDADDQHTDEVRDVATDLVSRLGGNASDAWLDTLFRDPHKQGEEFDHEGKSIRTLYTYTAPFPGTPDVDTVVSGLEITNASIGPAFGGDHVYLETADGWRLAIEVRTIEWRLDPDIGPATVNAFDQIHTGIPEDLAGEESASQDWIMGRFGAEGAPGPTFEDWDYETAIC